MSTNKGLGRGLDSLIPMDVDVRELSVSNADHQVLKIPAATISPNRAQPRTEFSEVELASLTESVREHGILQPLLVTKEGEKYELVAGERRLRAAKAAGLIDVPVIITTADELRRAELALIENVQREDLQPLELAASLHHLHYDFGLEYDVIGKRIGKASTTVVNLVRLMQLPEAAKEALRQQKISEGHARAVLSLKDFPEKQAELLDFIIRFDWSVRKAEQYVVAFKQGATTTSQALRSTRVTTPDTARLSQRLGTKVTLKRMAKGGQLMISYKNEDQLKTIVTELLDQV